MRRSLGMFALLLVLVPASAAAHSNRVEMDPADGATLKTLPAEATVTFNEPPETAAVVLASPDRTVHKLATEVVGSTVKVRLPASGPRGAYTLTYRVVSADGHPVFGSTTFTITTGPAPAMPGPAPSPTSPVASTRLGAPGSLALVVIGVAVVGFVGMMFVARSQRR